jgi:hypothetical protein
MPQRVPRLLAVQVARLLRQILRVIRVEITDPAEVGDGKDKEKGKYDRVML